MGKLKKRVGMMIFKLVWLLQFSNRIPLLLAVNAVDARIITIAQSVVIRVGSARLSCLTSVCGVCHINNGEGAPPIISLHLLSTE